MRAMVLERPGEALREVELPDPEPGSGQVLLRVAACGVCLPSFYFFALLAGVRTSMVQVTAMALKGLAVTGLVLAGLLPAYIALALGMILFRGPSPALEHTLLAGFVLPFVAGLFGARSLLRSFVDLSGSLPWPRRGSRPCFLRRLITAWSGLYTVITPLMVYTLWTHLQP